jgi:uncharacterized protein
MPERDGYLPGVPCWVDVSEPDLEAAVDFFGWDFEDLLSPSSPGPYLVARCEAPGSSIFDTSRERRRGEVGAVGSVPGTTSPAAMWNTYFWVDSAAETASRVREAGGDVVVEPFDFVDACRVAVLTDPEGAMFRVWEARGHRGANLVNDPGCVVFNALNTRDVDGARSFYRSVFGWQTSGIGGGAVGWTLSGYGDYLVEQYHPDLRRQMAEAGAPEGFEDVVGGIVPLADDQPDVPAHWAVTFAVDDADATAARVAELGGMVIVPPFDAPWSTPTYTIRMTVLADPQGATFSASRFIPKT